MSCGENRVYAVCHMLSRVIIRRKESRETASFFVMLTSEGVYRQRDPLAVLSSKGELMIRGADLLEHLFN